MLGVNKENLLEEVLWGWPELTAFSEKGKEEEMPLHTF